MQHPSRFGNSTPESQPNDLDIHPRFLSSELIHLITYLRDIPVIQAMVLVFALLIISTNLLADLSYGLFDPRIRLK